MARSDNGANASSTGSLTTSAPTAIVAPASPPNVILRLEPGTSAGPALRRPTQAAPIANGRVPYAFEMRTRSTLPPMLTRGIMRSVWLANAAPSAGAGAAVQVPTQCASSFMMSPYIVRAFPIACAWPTSRCAISGMCRRSMYGPMLDRPPRLCMKASSLPGVGRGLTHRLQIGLAALLEQSVHAAVEVLHAQSEELGNEVVGAATPGDAAGASDDLDATLHRLLHVRVSLLAGEPHRLRQVFRPDEVHVHPCHGNQIRQVLDRLHFFDHQAHEGLAVGFPGIVSGGTLEAVASRTTAAENASMTLRAVLHGIDGGPGFIRCVDVGNLHAPGAPIQERRNDFRLVPDRAHDGRHSAQLSGGDARLGVVDCDGAMLVVEQDPVEAKVTEHLDHGRRGEGAHDAKGSFPGVEPLLKRV